MLRVDRLITVLVYRTYRLGERQLVPLADNQKHGCYRVQRNDLYWNNREDFKFEPWWQQCFTHVANVDTACPDEAFHIMNLWGEENEEKVTRIGPLHSLSVGDVLIDELTGNALLCAPSGWTAIDWEWNDYDDCE